MIQRKIYSKIWKDEWFCSLSQNARLLFIYLITNEFIGFTGCYELTDRQIIFDTKITSLEKVKQELYPKAKFYNGWVYVENAQGYNNFVGDSFEKAITKEKNLIPENIINTLVKGKDYPTPGVTVGWGGDTNSIYNSNNNNNNNINTNIKKYSKLEDLTEVDFEEIAEKYRVPISFVKSKFDDMVNWHEENPIKNKKLNWKATLTNWTKRDSLSIKQEYAKRNNEVSI